MLPWPGRRRPSYQKSYWNRSWPIHQIPFKEYFMRFFAVAKAFLVFISFVTRKIVTIKALCKLHFLFFIKTLKEANTNSSHCPSKEIRLSESWKFIGLDHSSFCIFNGERIPTMSNITCFDIFNNMPPISLVTHRAENFLTYSN